MGITPTYANDTRTRNRYWKPVPENMYQYSAGVSYESVSIFSGTKIWYGVEQCSTPCRKLVQAFWYQFSVPVSGACDIGFSNLSCDQIWNFFKFKTADGRHIQRRFLAKSQQTIVRFQWNFAWRIHIILVMRQIPAFNRAHFLFTSDKGGGTCFCPCLFVCLSVSLLARLLKNACMDLDEMLRVDRCRDMDELINFWARSGS